MQNEHTDLLASVFTEIQKTVVGQNRLVRNCLIAVLSKGHMLLEWVPWLWKTLLASTVAATLDLDFKRISFTPDLLPLDITGSEIYSPEKGTFSVKKGPVFTNFLLADEINRAPAKVQSALLEAMEQRQITIGDQTYPLPSPFLVIATQNPIEQEGTYRLPEAQLDRFLLKTVVWYPNIAEEMNILKTDSRRMQHGTAETVLKKADLETLQKTIPENVYVDEKIIRYIADIVFATRPQISSLPPSITKLISLGASPRASLAFLRTARVLAFLEWRDFVIPEDIKDLAIDILWHRIIPSFDAIGEGINADTIVDMVLKNVLVP